MSIRESIFWTTLQFFVLIGIELASLAVLARILTPGQMGQYALAFAITRLFQFVGNFGMFAVIVRADAMERDDRARVLAVTLTAGGAATAVLAAAAWLPTPLFGDETRALLRVMLLTVLPVGLGMIMTALLTRQLRFRTLLALRICATVTFPAVAIPLALSGHGPLSLAYGYAASTLLYAALGLVATSGAFLVRPATRGLRQMLGFAATLFSASALAEAAEAALPAMIGRLLGFDALGLFSRARELIVRANLAMTDTVMPALTPHLFTAGREQRDLRQGFLTGLTNMTAICLPAAGLLWLASPMIVRLLLGPAWTAATPILGLLAIGLCVTPLSALAGLFALTLRKERILLYQGAVYLAGMLAVGASAAWFGVIQVAGALVALQVAMAILYLTTASAVLKVGPLAMVRAIAPSVVVLAATLAPALLVHHLVAAPAPLAGLALDLVAGGFGWLAGVFLTHHPLRAEILALATGKLGAR